MVTDIPFAWRFADVRFYADGPTILWSSNAKKAYRFGNEFGETGLVVAGSYDDAWDEVLEHLGDSGEICDHGDPDELKALVEARRYDDAAEWISSHCDCELDPSGRYVNTMYAWMERSLLTVEQIRYAFDYEEEE